MKTPNRNKILVVLLVFITVCKSNGQQLASFTQYSYNMLSVNPAYAGYEVHPNLTLSTRKQWVDVPGAPFTASLSLNGRPENHQKIGLGLIAHSDKIGVSTTTKVYAAYSHKIISKNKNSYTNWYFHETTLSLGLLAGFDNYSEDLQALDLNNDPHFSESYSAMVPNFGFGIFFSANSYFVGFSVPKLFGSTLNISKELTIDVRNHLFLMGGKIFPLTRDLKLKPIIFLKYVRGAPLQVDLNTNLLLKERVELGLTYRPNTSISLISIVNCSKKLSLGYSFDYSRVTDVSLSSHELIAQFRFIPLNH
ncbi:PorP/SprF family type IX secretion system membrane protein [Xanthovirga aplysinae]|uniref:PorP/SprF family type IX secretion system membrane protein n=1 Tax=Xanthovirga aplysinae TaxID=2529853 RepID=UPI0012BCB442|nr:type IX secretion system membrane protein PorP/SprF [Xanthovirga aplysinae]MTI32415.1 type IX secretion system membrane protein PorP/SprF [Xanthovirga aplysinae]